MFAPVFLGMVPIRQATLGQFEGPELTTPEEMKRERDLAAKRIEELRKKLQEKGELTEQEWYEFRVFSYRHTPEDRRGGDLRSGGAPGQGVPEPRERLSGRCDPVRRGARPLAPDRTRGRPPAGPGHARQDHAPRPSAFVGARRAVGTWSPKQDR